MNPVAFLVTSLLACSLFFTLASVVDAYPVGYKGKYAGHKVYRFTVVNEDQVRLLNDYVNDATLGVDVWSDVHVGIVDLRSDRLPSTALHILDDVNLADIERKVIIDDVQAVVNKDRSHMNIHSNALRKQVVSGNGTTISPWDMFADYQSLETIVAFISGLPGITQVSIGKSYNGADIPGFQFGNGTKRFMYQGGIHAREWIAPAVAAFITTYLTMDPSAADFLQKFTFTVVPVVNVDGYAYTRDPNGDRLFRKNVQPNAGSSCIGTDLNRNWDVAWGSSGASGDPCSKLYYGSAPFSAPETKALAQYISKLENLVGFIDFHSYSEKWMFPNGFTCSDQVKDYQTLLTGANKAVEALAAVNGIVFKFGDICHTIYPASGSAADWVYHNVGAIYSYVVELRGNTGDPAGFLLPADQIFPTGKEVQAAFTALLNFMVDELKLDEVTTTTSALPTPTTCRPDPSTSTSENPASASAVPIDPRFQSAFYCDTVTSRGTTTQDLTSLAMSQSTMSTPSSSSSTRLIPTSLLLSVLIAISLFISPSAASNSFQLQLNPHARDCFHEVLKVGEKFDIYFEVYDGGALDIDFWVSGPDERIIYNVFKQTTQTFAFTADQEGTHTYCFSNQMSSVTAKVLTFTIHGPLERLKYEEKYKDSKEDFHTPLSEEIARLAETMQGVYDEQAYMRHRLTRHRETAISTNGRVVYWSLFETLVLIVVCAFQVFYLTQFFSGRRGSSV
ncbi:Carboxypeptidase A4 [Blyttiomyces sp. JEL0837]|nr:Carboxypeptidase A4 [Blyttiomyces sp. JEL0837]